MNIILSPLAEFKLQKTVNYLIDEWSIEVKNKFLNQLNNKFQQVKKYPYSCKKVLLLMASFGVS